MKSNKPDISLIRKYLNGELDAKAMYKLERQAQDDPMLMDVIMGMEGDHQDKDDVALSEIDDLISKRVQDSKTVKIFAWKPWTAAASLIFAFMAAFWMFRSPQSLPVKQQMQVKQAVPAEKQPESPAENKVPAPVISPKIPLEHIQIAKSSGKTMKPELAKISAKTAAAPAPFDQVPAKAVVDSAAIARIALLKQNASKDSLRRAAILNQYAGNTSDKQLNEVVVVGYGATQKKAVQAAVSNLKPALSTSPATALQGKTPGIMITSDQSFSEVVVTKTRRAAPRKAQPGIGWEAYEKYLKEYAVLSDGTKGTVVITFSIGTDGLPANLKIVKSLSGEADKIAMGLIYGGSRWIAGKDDPAKEIKVKIRFR